MEYWDAYTLGEQKVDAILIRDQSIPKGLYHLVVEIIVITPTQEVLITKRAPTKTFPLEWEITGG